MSLMCFCMVQVNDEVDIQEPAGEEPWVFDFPLPDRPESINHGSTDGFNFGGSLGFVYEAMGVHSAVICGKKQVEDVGRDEMVSWSACLCNAWTMLQVPYSASIHSDFTQLCSKWLHQMTGLKHGTWSLCCHLRMCLKAQPVVHASAGYSPLNLRQWTEMQQYGPKGEVCEPSSLTYGRCVDADYADGGC